VEFLNLTLPQIDSAASIIRLMRAKQHRGVKRAENVVITPAMEDAAQARGVPLRLHDARR